MLCVLGISNLNWITMGVLPLRVFLHYTLYLSQSQSELVVWVCKCFVTVLVRIAEGTEDTEDAEGCFGNFKLF